jgi:hypothetical protein
MMSTSFQNVGTVKHKYLEAYIYDLKFEKYHYICSAANTIAYDNKFCSSKATQAENYYFCRLIIFLPIDSYHLLTRSYNNVCLLWRRRQEKLLILYTAWVLHEFWLQTREKVKGNKHACVILDLFPHRMLFKMNTSYRLNHITLSSRFTVITLE